MMNHIKSMTLPEMGEVLKGWRQPAFRAKQVFTWLHKGVGSYQEMTNLPQSLRQQLEETYPLYCPQVVRKQQSQKDGTIVFPTATAWKRCLCATTTATRCASPRKWGAPWAAPSAPPP